MIRRVDILSKVDTYAAVAANNSVLEAVVTIDTTTAKSSVKPRKVAICAMPGHLKQTMMYKTTMGSTITRVDKNDMTALASFVVRDVE
jgi:hypothetical protein